MVGAGFIGMSWSIVFARAGWNARLYDRAPEVRAGLPRKLRAALADLARAGLCNDPEATFQRVAVCDTLPALQGEEADAVRRLVEQGPPAEEVGLEPYGTDPVIATSIPIGAPQ